MIYDCFQFKYNIYLNDIKNGTKKRRVCMYTAAIFPCEKLARENSRAPPIPRNVTVVVGSRSYFVRKKIKINKVVKMDAVKNGTC